MDELESEKIRISKKLELQETKSKLLNQIKEIDIELNALNKKFNENSKVKNSKVERIKVVEEYKEKLRNILSVFEYDIVIKGMNTTEYNGGKMIMIDIEKIYDTIISYKQKFTSIKIESLQITGQVDTLPPESFYAFNFSIYDNSDIIIGSGGMLSMNSAKLRKMNELISENSEFNFLSKDEKNIMAYETENYTLEELVNFLPRLKEIKQEFPFSTFNGFTTVDDEIVYYIS